MEERKVEDQRKETLGFRRTEEYKERERRTIWLQPWHRRRDRRIDSKRPCRSLTRNPRRFTLPPGECNRFFFFFFYVKLRYQL